jgi:Proteobacterial transcriptional regulator-like domain
MDDGARLPASYPGWRAPLTSVRMTDAVTPPPISDWRRRVVFEVIRQSGNGFRPAVLRLRKIRSHSYEHILASPDAARATPSACAFASYQLHGWHHPVTLTHIVRTSMPPVPDWRSADAYAYLNDLTPAELAWEFLRRNPDYQREFRTTIPPNPDEDDGPERSAKHWGLQFLDRSGTARGQGAAGLASPS